MNYLVSRLTEFVGKDGKIYNAAWGPINLIKGVLGTDDVLQIGNAYFNNVSMTNIAAVPCEKFPEVNGIYTRDTRRISVYDATKA